MLCCFRTRSQTNVLGSDYQNNYFLGGSREREVSSRSGKRTKKDTMSCVWWGAAKRLCKVGTRQCAIQATRKEAPKDIALTKSHAKEERPRKEGGPSSTTTTQVKEERKASRNCRLSKCVRQYFFTRWSTCPSSY